jgi:hypothetical protein
MIRVLVIASVRPSREGLALALAADGRLEVVGAIEPSSDTADGARITGRYKALVGEMEGQRRLLKDSDLVEAVNKSPEAADLAQRATRATEEQRKAATDMKGRIDEATRRLVSDLARG